MSRFLIPLLLSLALAVAVLPATAQEPDPQSTPGATPVATVEPAPQPAPPPVPVEPYTPPALEEPSYEAYSQDEFFSEPIYVRPFYDPPLPFISDFETLQYEIDALMADRVARLSVTVLSDQGMVFRRAQDETFALASVVKLFIMAAYLDKLSWEGRPMEEWEYSILDSMITYSDNDSAEYLWQEIGWSEGLQAYLLAHGFSSFIAAEDDAWGGSSITSSEAALFMSELASGMLLDADDTALALDLLSKVWEAQRWGVTAGVAWSDPEAAILLKNGWYPEWEGWRLNSVGLVVPGNGLPAYTLVVFGDGFETYEDGLYVIERVAAMTNSLMLPLIAGPPAPPPESL